MQTAPACQTYYIYKAGAVCIDKSPPYRGKEG